MYIIYFVSDSKRACALHGGGLRFLKHDFIFGSYRIYITRSIKSTYIIVLYSRLHAYIILYHRHAVQGGCLFNNHRTGHFLVKCIRFRILVIILAFTF